MIKKLDLSENTLYFADVLEKIVLKFNVQEISRAKIAFGSLKELEGFPVNIDTSTLYVFDPRKYEEIDMSKIPVSGFSTINFSTSFGVYRGMRKFQDENFFPSIMNKGDELFRTIIGNSSLKKIDFYTPKSINLIENLQKNVSLKVPETLEF